MLKSDESTLPWLGPLVDYWEKLSEEKTDNLITAVGQVKSQEVNSILKHLNAVIPDDHISLHEKPECFMERSRN